MKQISLAQFSGDSAEQRFAEAAAYLRDHPGTTLTVPPGTYLLTDPLARRRQEQVMNGEFGSKPQAAMFNPRYEYTRGIHFDGLRDCTVVADGVTLLVDGFMEPISVTHCENLTLRGFTVDHKRKPYSKAHIVRLEEESPTGEREALLEFKRDPITIHAPMQLRHVFYDPHTARNIQAALAEYEILDAHHMKAWLANAHELAVGMEFYTMHTYHSRPAILLEHCRELRLENVTIHSQPGMGIVGNRCENVTISGLWVVPSCGDHVSTNTDATHFTSMKGKLRLENCVFDGQGDDSTNVHTYYQTVIAESDGWYELQEKTPTGTHAQTLDYPDVGDELEWTNLHTLETAGHFRVLECIPDPAAWKCRVRLDRELPGQRKGWALADLTRLPELEFVGCTASRHFARSVLIKCRSALVEDCTFRDTYGPAVVAAAESWWHEGVCPANITVRRCRILGCAVRHGQASGVVVMADAPDPLGQSIRNVCIEDNLIEAQHPYGIYVRNADKVVIRRNRILSGGIAIEDCTQVQCDQNYDTILKK